MAEATVPEAAAVAHHPATVPATAEAAAVPAASRCRIHAHGQGADSCGKGDGESSNLAVHLWSPFIVLRRAGPWPSSLNYIEGFDCRLLCEAAPAGERASDQVIVSAPTRARPS